MADQGLPLLMSGISDVGFLRRRNMLGNIGQGFLESESSLAELSSARLPHQDINSEALQDLRKRFLCRS